MSQNIKQLLARAQAIREEEMSVAGAPPEETRDAALGVSKTGVGDLSVGSPESNDNALPDPESAPDGEDDLSGVENLTPAGGEGLPAEPKKVELETGTIVRENKNRRIVEFGEDDDEEEGDELPPEEAEGEEGAPPDDLAGAEQELDGADDLGAPADDMPADDGESGNIDDILANVDSLLKAAMDNPELNVQIGIDHSGADAAPEAEAPPEELPPEEPEAAPPEEAPEMGSEEDYGEDQEAMESLLGKQ